MGIFSGLRTLLVLGRVSNLPTVWTNAAVGWFLSGGTWSPELGWVILGISLLYIAGMSLNDAFDTRWDRENAPDRPIPSGRISPASVWIIGVLEMIGGAVILVLFTSVHLWLIAALILCILFYNWIHKRWKGSVTVMGLCRALVYLSAGSATVSGNGTLAFENVVMMAAAISVIYIAGLTLAARSEHLKSATGPSRLARLMLMLPVLLPLLGSRTMSSSPVNIALTVVGVIGVWAWITITRSSLKERVPLGVAYAIAGIAFYDASILAFVDWRAAVAALVCFVLTLGAQRVIPAT
tara:strand:- start:4076 stop:4960 length:885 start_codon:yes stop_codon:yes gene_type:complete